MEDTSAVHRLLLWNPSTRETIELPPRNLNDLEDLYGCILLAPPTDPDCMIMFWSENFLLYWNLGDTTWTKQPYDLGFILEWEYIHSVIVSAADKRIYAVTLQERLAIIDRDPCGVLAVRMLTTKRIIGYHEICYRDTSIVEFGGDIFVVHLHYVCMGHSNAITGIEVFKMDFSKDDWVKVQDLGDLTLCLSEQFTNSVLFSHTKLGFKRNHVYIVLNDGSGLYVHSLKDDSLSFYALRLPTPFSSPFWSTEFHKKNEDGCTEGESNMDLVMGKVDKETETISMPTKVIGDPGTSINILEEILVSIAMRLPLPTDCINFRLVSKAFFNSLPTIRWTPDTSGTTIQYPWLMYSKREKSKCSFLDPLCSVTHCLDMTELLGAKIWFSMAGWLVMSIRIQFIFLFNPFTKVTIVLPMLPYPYIQFYSVSLSAPPTSPDCIVFGYSRATIYFMRIGEEGWTYVERQHDDYNNFTFSISNPVFHNGAFYCLGRQNDMGVFCLKDDGTSDWITHHLPSPDSSVHQNYLVKSNGNLLAILVGRKGAWVHVYRLRITHMSGNINMSWESVNSLEDQTLFMSRYTSLSLKAISKEMENKIYFPLLFNNKKNNNMFYSLETRKWQSSFGDCCTDDIYNSTEQLHCTWIQPTLRWNEDRAR